MTRIPGTCARYVIRDRTLYVFCGGTSGREQMRENLRLRRVRFRAFRVNAADLREAERVHDWLIGEWSRFDWVQAHGFSRGAAIAALVALMCAGPDAELWLYAPKRAGCRKLVDHCRFRLQAFRVDALRCDIIPLLPPWYAGWRCSWSRWVWPWKAHEQSARDFARARHEAGR